MAVSTSIGAGAEGGESCEDVGALVDGRCMVERRDDRSLFRDIGSTNGVIDFRTVHMTTRVANCRIEGPEMRDEGGTLWGTCQKEEISSIFHQFLFFASQCSVSFSSRRSFSYPWPLPTLCLRQTQGS